MGILKHIEPWVLQDNMILLEGLLKVKRCPREWVGSKESSKKFDVGERPGPRSYRELCSYKRCSLYPDTSKPPFLTYFVPEDENTDDMKPLIADLGDVDPFLITD
ncbi:unnamed protein product [Vicia faba]|uniref:Uncharacterized protein n=1 Tax=Vicia faba TaxID=3906 RepID=A0AAV0Z8C2_VICFA|nr:unnamed protein product [Vicia faba]